MSLTASEITALLEKDQEGISQHKLRQQFYAEFDQAAVFLLDWQHENLFEPVRATRNSTLEFRCKGCRRIVLRWRMKEHHSSHKREYERIRES